MYTVYEILTTPYNFTLVYEILTLATTSYINILINSVIDFL